MDDFIYCLTLQETQEDLIHDWGMRIALREYIIFLSSVLFDEKTPRFLLEYLCKSHPGVRKLLYLPYVLQILENVIYSILEILDSSDNTAIGRGLSCLLEISRFFLSLKDLDTKVGIGLLGDRYVEHPL